MRAPKGQKKGIRGQRGRRYNFLTELRGTLFRGESAARCDIISKRGGGGTLLNEKRRVGGEIDTSKKSGKREGGGNK